MDYELIKIWVGAIVAISVFAYIFKETGVYRFLVHVILGSGIAISVVIIWDQVLKPKWWEPMTQAWIKARHLEPSWALLWTLAIVPGIMWYFLYSRKYGWVARIVFGLLIGVGAGLTFKDRILRIMPQIAQSIKPFVVITDGRFDLFHSVNNIIFVMTLLTVLSYFFFSFKYEHRLVVRSAMTGRWMMMVCFGALFGFTVMTRMAYFLERLGFLIKDWFLKAVMYEIFKVDWTQLVE